MADTGEERGASSATETLVMHLHRETDKAFRVSENGEDEDATWIAKSILSDWDIRRTGKGRATIEIVLPEWLAKKNGWL